MELYSVLEEPLYPPSQRVSWSSYRPDLLGFRSSGGRDEVVIVECETHPSMARFTSKNYSSLWFEPSVLSQGSIRRILAVPRGTLHAVDLRLRGEWEIWVLGATAPLERIAAFDRSPAP